MSWSDLLILGIVLGVATVFVWRSSGKSHQHGCDCGCGHETKPANGKKNSAP